MSNTSALFAKFKHIANMLGIKSDGGVQSPLPPAIDSRVAYSYSNMIDKFVTASIGGDTEMGIKRDGVELGGGKRPRTAPKFGELVASDAATSEAATSSRPSTKDNYDLNSAVEGGPHGKEIRQHVEDPQNPINQTHDAAVDAVESDPTGKNDLVQASDRLAQLLDARMNRLVSSAADKVSHTLPVTDFKPGTDAAKTTDEAADQGQSAVKHPVTGETAHYKADTTPDKEELKDAAEGAKLSDKQIEQEHSGREGTAEDFMMGHRHIFQALDHTGTAVLTARAAEEVKGNLEEAVEELTGRVAEIEEQLGIVVKVEAEEGHPELNDKAPAPPAPKKKGAFALLGDKEAPKRESKPSDKEDKEELDDAKACLEGATKILAACNNVTDALKANASALSKTAALIAEGKDVSVTVERLYGGSSKHTMYKPDKDTGRAAEDAAAKAGEKVTKDLAAQEVKDKDRETFGPFSNGIVHRVSPGDKQSKYASNVKLFIKADGVNIPAAESISKAHRMYESIAAKAQSASEAIQKYLDKGVDSERAERKANLKQALTVVAADNEAVVKILEAAIDILRGGADMPPAETGGDLTTSAPPPPADMSMPPAGAQTPAPMGGPAAPGLPPMASDKSIRRTANEMETRMIDPKLDTAPELAPMSEDAALEAAIQALQADESMMPDHKRLIMEILLDKTESTAPTVDPDMLAAKEGVSSLTKGMPVEDPMADPDNPRVANPGELIEEYAKIDPKTVYAKLIKDKDPVKSKWALLTSADGPAFYEATIKDITAGKDVSQAAIDVFCSAEYGNELLSELERRGIKEMASMLGGKFVRTASAEDPKNKSEYTSFYSKAYGDASFAKEMVKQFKGMKDDNASLRRQMAEKDGKLAEANERIKLIFKASRATDLAREAKAVGLVTVDYDAVAREAAAAGRDVAASMAEAEKNAMKTEIDTIMQYNDAAFDAYRTKVEAMAKRTNIRTASGVSYISRPEVTSPIVATASASGDSDALRNTKDGLKNGLESWFMHKAKDGARLRQ